MTGLFFADQWPCAEWWDGVDRRHPGVVGFWWEGEGRDEPDLVESDTLTRSMVDDENEGWPHDREGAIYHRFPEPCRRRIWDGRYWCVLTEGHDGPHESAPFGDQQPWSEAVYSGSSKADRE